LTMGGKVEQFHGL